MKKNFFAFLLVAVSLVGCRSYSALENTPVAQLPAKLPAMEVVLDEPICIQFNHHGSRDGFLRCQ